MTTYKKPLSQAPTSEEVGGYASEEIIRERAYERYKQRGGTDGLDLEDWLAAEAELRHSTPA